MMELNEQQLELLARMGKTFFGYDVCATALEVDEMDLKKALQDRNSAAFKAYYSGFLTSELKHREGVINLGERGSGPAQQMVQKFIDTAKRK